MPRDRRSFILDFNVDDISAKSTDNAFSLQGVAHEYNVSDHWTCMKAYSIYEVFWMNKSDRDRRIHRIKAGAYI